jgi:hypothetical protein
MISLSVADIQAVSCSRGGMTMQYQLAPLYCRPWTLNGISARLIESHYENNYGAALNRLKPNILNLIAFVAVIIFDGFFL